MSQRGVDYSHVRSNADFAKVVGKYGITLTGEGDQKSGLCPFHDDTKPSLRVNTSKNVFKCHACGKGGNVLDFVREADANVENVFQAAHLVAKISGITIRPDMSGKVLAVPVEELGPTPISAQTDREKEAAQEGETVELCNKPLDFTLKVDVEGDAIVWLRDKGLPSSGHFYDQLGIGLASRGLMKGRIVFPIHDEVGQLVGYSGRWIGEAIPEDSPKWLLPRNFHKKLVLYGLNLTPQGSEKVVLVESPLSVVAHTHSDKLTGQVVACFGHSLSDHHVMLLKQRGVRRVSINFDGDKAGREGAKAAAGKLAAAGIWAKVAATPEGRKPHNMSYVEMVAANNHSTVEDAEALIRANIDSNTRGKSFFRKVFG